MRDNCLELPWVQEGNRVITRVIQSSTSLAHKKYKVLASTDAARDEEGTTLRPSDKVELATLFAAAPDLLAALREMVEAFSMENIGVDALARNINAKKLARAAIAKAVGGAK